MALCGHPFFLAQKGGHTEGRPYKHDFRIKRLEDAADFARRFGDRCVELGAIPPKPASGGVCESTCRVCVSSWSGLLQTDVPHMAVKPLFRISPEQARDARARAWSFVFECYENNKAAGATTGEVGADLSRRLGTAKKVKPGTS